MSGDAFNDKLMQNEGIQNDIQGFERFLGPINQRFLDARFGRVNAQPINQALIGGLAGGTPQAGLPQTGGGGGKGGLDGGGRSPGIGTFGPGGAPSSAAGGAQGGGGGLLGQAGQIGGQFGGLAGLAGQAGQAGAGNLRDIAGGVGDVAGRFQQIGTSGIDSRFQQQADAQLGLLESQRQQAVGGAETRAQRQGIRGSALQNELSRVESPFRQQGQALQSQLGMQALQRGDQALANAANVMGQQGQLEQAALQAQQQGLGQAGGFLGAQANQLGQQAGFLGQALQGQMGATQANNQALGSELGAARAAIENRQLPIAQQIGLVAAQNAGEGGGGGDDKGGLFGGGGSQVPLPIAAQAAQSAGLGGGGKGGGGK